MKALKSKKGFTLVELMIVVVIMAILVAVAVPVYSAVTKNAESKTCHTNCDIIEKAAIQYLMSTDEIRADAIIPNGELTVKSQEDAEQNLPEGFLACFNGGEFPECPTGHYYTVKVSEDNDNITVEVSCDEHGDKYGK